VRHQIAAFLERLGSRPVPQPFNGEDEYESDTRIRRIQPKWRRRLFHQQKDPSTPPMLAGAVGFIPPYEAIPIDDDYRLEHLQRAVIPDQRADAAYRYLQKVLANATEAASERGDDELASQIDAVREHLAGGILTAIYLLKQGMRQRGYDDGIIDAPQWMPRGTSE
jgi:hypothetical protein